MDRQSFLALSPGEVAELVRADGPKVCVFPINGTRRWFALEHPAEASQGLTQAYLRISGRRHIALYRLLFDHGIDTILTPVFGPDILERGQAYRLLLREGLAWFAADEGFLDFYDAYDVRVRVYGEAQAWLEDTPYEHALDAYDEVASRTASHQVRRLFFGVCAHDASEAVARIAIAFHRQHQRAPSRREILAAYYGEVVEPVDLFIGFDRPAAFDMPLVSTGSEDLYFTVCPSLYFDAHTLKLILYDHLYARRVDDGTYADLSPDDWKAMADFYAANRHRVLGLGHRHPSGSFWYPAPQVDLPDELQRHTEERGEESD